MYTVKGPNVADARRWLNAEAGALIVSGTLVRESVTKKVRMWRRGTYQLDISLL